MTPATNEINNFRRVQAIILERLTDSWLMLKITGRAD